MSGARTTDDTFTHIQRFADGYVLTWRADHGGVYVDIKAPYSRSVSTNRLPIARAVWIARRIAEIAAVAPSTGGQRP